MKRIIAIALLATLMVGLLCGCKKDGAKAGADAGYRVGFAREDVMPEKPTSLAGYGNYANRVNKGYLDMLYSHATAITDQEDNTLIMIANDSMNCPDGLAVSRFVLYGIWGCQFTAFLYECACRDPCRRTVLRDLRHFRGSQR